MNWSERAFLVRWQLAVLVLLLFLAVGVSIAFGIVAHEASLKVARIQAVQQQNRITAIQELCEHDNANAEHNVDFIRKVSPDLILLARRTFRKTPNCRTFARQTARLKP